MQLPNKIYIIWAAWSWKSTLAKKIVAIKNIPFFTWDDIVWSKKFTEKSPIWQRTNKLHDIMKQNKKRIIECGGIGWADECYQNADLVIIFNVPRFLLARRILKRYVSHIVHWDFSQTFVSMIKIIQRAMTYYNPKSEHSLYRHVEDCKKYNCKYIVIRDAKEVLS